MRRVLILLLSICAWLPLAAQRDISCPVIRPGEIIITHHGHILSYDPDAMIPIWTAYSLCAGDTKGSAIRASSFRPDPAPELAGYPLAEHKDYARSGWARGHMIPAGDLKYDQLAMDDSFLTTNVCPMDIGFNNGIWRRLEEKVRRWAGQFGQVQIITGPVIGANRYGKVGNSNILVPDAFFKAVLVFDGGSYLSIGFYMPNEPAPDGAKLKDYAVTVADLERLIGRRLFSSLSWDSPFDIKGMLPLKELGLY